MKLEEPLQEADDDELFQPTILELRCSFAYR
jgi:hypothetical protein